MKARKIILSLIVAAAPALLITSCIKKHTATAPLADTELQSSVDASYALFCITDAEMISSFVADYPATPKFYKEAPGSAGPVTLVGSDVSLDVTCNFNDATCVDGHQRDGAVYLYRGIDQNYNPNANANSIYYRRFGFSERLTLTTYVVDGWHITTNNDDFTSEGVPCLVANLLGTDNTTTKPSANLSWHIKGNFKLTKGSDVMLCKVDLIKTILNTSDASVVPVNGTSPINWSLATVAYSGKISGTTPGNVPFSMTIDESNPVIRDFTCSPDKVSNVTVGANDMTMQQTSEFHPFKDGTAHFTTGELYPREIYYGGSEAIGKGQCDNSGAVLIKGISYPVDFKK